MSVPGHPTIESLLAHANWVRSLARRLVADPDVAEDLVQDTFVAALSHPPEHHHGFASWLATTLHNVRRTRQRRELARGTIEPLGARRERVVSTDELAAQADLQRALVEHVLALEEPYRSTLLLRYFAELEPADIAAREKIPLATVTSRLTRAHARLRERLDRAHGDRTTWFSALLPLVSRPETLAAVPAAGSVAVLGGLVMNVKLVASGVALALIVIVASFALRGSSVKEPEPTVALEHSDAPLAASHPPADGATSEAGDAPSARKAEALPASSKSGAISELPPARAPVHVRGRLLGPDGLALSGLRVGWNGTREGSVVTEASGAFEIDTTAAQGELDVADAGWVTVRSGSWTAGTALEPIVVAARSVELGGTVRDESGTPLAGARISLELPAGFSSRFGRSLEATTTRSWRAQSGADGRFSLPKTPLLEGAWLGTVLEGYAASEIEEPAMADMAIAIVLERPKIPLVGALRGRVVDEHGNAVPEARVFLGLASTTSDGEGHFGITLARAVSSDRITAIKAGFLAGSVDRPHEPREGDTGWPELVEVRLPGAALSLAGVVVDPEDHPLARVRVWLADPTPVGAIGKMPAFAENLMAGAPVPPQALESEARAPKVDGDNFNDYSTNEMASCAFWHWVLTDEAGRFEIRGLSERNYRLRLMDPKTLSATTTEEIRAGDASVRVVMPKADLLPKLAGRVLDDAGAAVAGVEVRLTAEAVGVRARVFGGNVFVTVRPNREEAVSDAEGRFEFTDVPRAGMQITLSSEQIVPLGVDVPSLANPAAFTVEVHTRCSLEVLVASKDLIADSVAVRDGDGEPIDIMVIARGSTNAYTSVPIVDGRSGVVSTSSAARTVDLYKDGVLVKSAPIRLRAGIPNLVEM
ncbi:MAG TPA: sigma-70 family RNA polymerase sigma factor [Planctomycetota bacterium]|nr:sigma-70 family RNA polymerase sigma factor [Planctomycetota bacterium]